MVQWTGLIAEGIRLERWVYGTMCISDFVCKSVTWGEYGDIFLGVLVREGFSIGGAQDAWPFLDTNVERR